jgi:hypothetical protein
LCNCQTSLFKSPFYDKKDHFNFPIVNFPSICSNIPAALANGVHVSQLMRYSRACDSFHDLLDRGLLLTGKLHDGAVRGTDTSYISSAPELSRVLVGQSLLDL